MGELALADSSRRRERQRSERREETQRPVCCQNCFAYGKACSGKRTMCSSTDGVDTSSSSGKIVNCTSRIGTDKPSFVVRSSMNARHCSATRRVGQSRQLSPSVPNFCSQIPASYKTC